MCIVQVVLKIWVEDDYCFYVVFFGCFQFEGNVVCLF